MRQGMHPDGMADLIASILADDDIDADLQGMARQRALAIAIDKRREQVLGLAVQHYKVNPINFPTERRERPTNGNNNLAKLNRANLHG